MIEAIRRIGGKLCYLNGIITDWQKHISSLDKRNQSL